MTNRYQDWLHQAENDLKWAEHSLSGGFFSQTCFIAQQAGEKALKALCFVLGFDVIKSHSLVQIIKSLKINGEMENLAKELDLYYISGRYPEAFPAGAPCQMFTEDQAIRAFEKAKKLVALATEKIHAAAQKE